jgi:hypothetical protein
LFLLVLLHQFLRRGSKNGRQRTGLLEGGDEVVEKLGDSDGVVRGVAVGGGDAFVKSERFEGSVKESCGRKKTSRWRRRRRKGQDGKEKADGGG